MGAAIDYLRYAKIIFLDGQIVFSGLVVCKAYELLSNDEDDEKRKLSGNNGFNSQKPQKKRNIFKEKMERIIPMIWKKKEDQEQAKKIFIRENKEENIDQKNIILRKGAISAQKDEKIIIPLSMRDGIILALGKGNEDWNFSAPHGAGRKMSRLKAKECIDIDNFKKSMKNVWSSTVSEKTIDEAPQAYKPKKEILENISDTAEILEVMKSVYNFKGH